MSSPDPSPAIAPCGHAKTWVEFVLVDADGNPAGGYRYVIKVGDREETGTLPASGKVRLENFDPGDCTVRLPDLDADAWGPL